MTTGDAPACVAASHIALRWDASASSDGMTTRTVTCTFGIATPQAFTPTALIPEFTICPTRLGNHRKVYQLLNMRGMSSARVRETATVDYLGLR
jgi:hypothetical protein